MLLSEIIIQKIKEEGPISFRDYMEICLYHPSLGYYTSSDERIGAVGDFYTSSNLTHRFGAMIGRQLEEMWQILGENEFRIVEFGAGTGQLCYDILEQLKHNDKFFNKLQYCIIEKSPAMMARQKKILNGKVSWYDHINEISGLQGCIISNELIDTFPVHRVVMSDKLYEIYVDYQDGFVEIIKPASEQLKNYFAELKVDLQNDFRTEINLDSTLWLKEIAESLQSGFVMTIDYGYTSRELYSNLRKNGTLMCYHKHQTNHDPYINIGHQDITSHINFSALCHFGWKNGLACCGLTDQASFLLSLGYKDHYLPQVRNGDGLAEAAKKEALLSRTLLFDIGMKFKVLVQRKGIQDCELSGLKVA